MSPPERYLDGSEKGESEPSSSGGSGVYRFPKSNVSEIEALARDFEENDRLWNWGYIIAIAFALLVWSIIGVGLYLWLR